MSPIRLEFKSGTDLVHIRPFAVNYIHKDTLYKEMQHMVALNILEKSACSATFIIPKPNGTVRIVSDFRK